MNKVHPYAELEREYITSQISLRELCRRHNIGAHSPVVVQAQKGKWQEKREAYQAKAGAAFIDRHADRMADRQAEISDKALDAIDEAITKFRSDMKATAKKRIDGGWVEVPVMRLGTSLAAGPHGTTRGRRYGKDRWRWSGAHQGASMGWRPTDLPMVDQ